MEVGGIRWPGEDASWGGFLALNTPLLRLRSVSMAVYMGGARVKEPRIQATGSLAALDLETRTTVVEVGGIRWPGKTYSWAVAPPSTRPSDASGQSQRLETWAVRG